MLGRTIRDWDDDQVVTILKNCHEAMAECGTLLFIEPLLTGDHGSAFEALGGLVEQRPLTQRLGPAGRDGPLRVARGPSR